VKGDFDAYLETLHPSERENDTQITGIRRFSWKRFSQQVQWYLAAGDPKSFEVVRRDGDGSERQRLFIKDKEHRARMPVPVRFKKAADGRWLITANSL